MKNSQNLIKGVIFIDKLPLRSYNNNCEVNKKDITKQRVVHSPFKKICTILNETPQNCEAVFNFLWWIYYITLVAILQEFSTELIILYL